MSSCLCVARSQACSSGCDSRVSCPSCVCIPRLFWFIKEIIYQVSLLRRHPCFIAGSALQTSLFTIVERSEVLKRDSSGGLIIIGAKNLITIYLTPLLIDAAKAYGRTLILPKLQYMLREPLRQSVDVQVAHFLNLTFLVFFFSLQLLGEYWWDVWLEVK